MEERYNCGYNEDICRVCMELRYSQDTKSYQCKGCIAKCCIHRIGEAKQLDTYEILEVLCKKCSAIRRVNQREADLAERQR